MIEIIALTGFYKKEGYEPGWILLHNLQLIRDVV